MKRRTRLWSNLAMGTLGIVVCWVILFQFRAVQPGGAPRKQDASILAGQKMRLPGAIAPVVPQAVRNATFRSPNAEEQDLSNRIIAASGNLKPIEGSVPGPRNSGVPRQLLQKTPVLSSEQQRALQKLRWGIAKDLSYRGDGEDATVRSLSSVALAAPDASAEDPGSRIVRFIAENRALFLLKNPESELVVKAVEPDVDGGTIVRIAQQFNGLEVWPGQLTANLSSAGYLTVVTGNYAPTPESVALTSQIRHSAAIAFAHRHLEFPRLSEPPVAALKIFADKGRTPELAYDVQLRADGRLERVFVSAVTGSILFGYSEICRAGVAALGTDLFGQNRAMNVLPSGTPQRFYVFDTSKPMYSPGTGMGVIAIYDGRFTAPPVSSSGTLNAGYDPAAVSAAYNLGKVYDFYYTVFGRNSFDGKGATIRGFVRTPDPKTQGLMANAYWDGYRNEIHFGGADNYAGSSDIVGHEYAHAVIDNSAKLIYKDESGAINESFSDIFAEAFERYLTGGNDWLLGTSLRASVRSMKQPESKGQPSTMSQYARQGGVHVNSGIANRAFYLLAEGLASGAVGFDSARNIFYRALTTKLNSRSDFQDLRAACVLAAIELFGAGSSQSIRTGQAFDAVEIFDSSAAGTPENLTPSNGPDSYLIAYKAVDGNTYLGRREAALGDGASVRGISNQPMNADSRASVSGDGSLAVFVSATNDVVLANTNGSSQQVAGSPGNFNSVTLSADGKYFACIARNPATRLAINKIIYINTSTLVSEVIDLYLPVADGPASISITSVDEVDLSPDGQIVLFDGLAKTTFADGTSVQAWSIFAADLRTKSVYSLAGPLSGFNIGNPSFARTSAQRIVFEAIDAASSYVLAYDLGRGELATVRRFTPGNSYLAYPRFSAGDDFVVFTEQFFSLGTFSYLPKVSRIALTSDRIAPTGNSFLLQEQAFSGLNYRRGSFAGSPTLSVAALTSSVTNGQSGTFRISRTSGDQAIRVPVTFKAVGTARPGLDYSQIPLNAAIPAGAISVDVVVRAAPSPSAGTRTLTLSLDPQYHYVIAANGGEATMSIVGGVLPSISVQPVARTVTAGASVSFSVTAAGTAPISYQWRKDGAAIAGGTASTLTLSNVQASAAGSYAVVVTNSVGSVTSAAAQLTVNPLPVAPAFAIQPSSQTAQLGGSVTFLVSASGTAPFTYQWLKDGVAIAGATQATLTLSNLQASGAGGYSVVVSNGVGSVTSGVAALTVIPSARLANLSVRTALAAQQTLIVGIVVSGGARDVLVRAVGPGLAAFGVAAAMSDPRLELYRGETLSLANDNWPASLAPVFAGAGAFGLPADSRDAAFRQTLDGGHSIQARGTGAGVVLVEAYDLGQGNAPRMVNVSARNRVGTGDDILIAGLNIAGTGSKQVLIRAVGPGLAAFGVPGTLSDPVLEVYNGSGAKIAENDNWSAALAPTFGAVGAFALPGSSRDAALLATLTPGSYSIQVKGADGGTGEAIVEIYEVP